MRRMLCAGLVVLVCDVVANAQQPEPARKQAVAIRGRDGAVVVEGRLDEPVWRTAPSISDFVQNVIRGLAAESRGDGAYQDARVVW